VVGEQARTEDHTRYLNGFAVIDLNGTTIQEQFFDENGHREHQATSC